MKEKERCEGEEGGGGGLRVEKTLPKAERRRSKENVCGVNKG